MPPARTNTPSRGAAGLFTRTHFLKIRKYFKHSEGIKTYRQIPIYPSFLSNLNNTDDMENPLHVPFCDPSPSILEIVLNLNAMFIILMHIFTLL